MRDKIKITIHGKEFEAQKRVFSSGNEGYGLYEKLELENDRFQISLNIIKLKKKTK